MIKLSPIYNEIRVINNYIPLIQKLREELLEKKT